MERNLALELVRVTEAAALASARWMGKGDGDAADRAARDAVSVVMKSVKLSGHVIIGDTDVSVAAPDKSNDFPDVDIAVDALQSIQALAYGRPHAIATIAVSNRGAFLVPPVPYMNKIAVGPDAVDAIDITAPIGENIRQVAKAKHLSVSDMTVCILDRPRHEGLMAEVRAAGARIRLITDGDVAGAISACRPNSGTDLLAGIGGTPEGIITAAAIRCMGGAIQGQLAPKDDEERQKAIDAGYDLDQILSTEDLVSGENVFFCATGVTDGDLLKGVQYYGGGCTTQSIVMRSKSGTVRMIEAYHRLSKLNEYSAIDFTGDSNAVYPLP